MIHGLLPLPWWGYVLVVLGLTHVTIAAVTIYLHRHQAHRALDLHPAVAHFFRFWLWLTTGMSTREWVAVHRKHHAFVESDRDPHSPQVHGIGKVLLEGAELYRREARQAETLAKYAHGTPDDWLERHLYGPHNDRGYLLMLVIDLALFGVLGLTVWAVQMMWIPLFAAGVINGVGHWGGYRNFETPDASTNIVPWGVLIGGEELHNNHHAFASSARFSTKWWEFDLGWLYIRLLSLFGLARVKKLAPRPVVVPSKRTPDMDTLTAVLTGRMHLMADYARSVLQRVYAEEVRKARGVHASVARRARRLLVREESRLSSDARERLDQLLGEYQALRVAYQYRRRLQALWQERSASQERLLGALQQWCAEAEQSGIRALQDFARMVSGYATQPFAA